MRLRYRPEVPAAGGGSCTAGSSHRARNRSLCRLERLDEPRQMFTIDIAVRFLAPLPERKTRLSKGGSLQQGAVVSSFCERRCEAAQSERWRDRKLVYKVRPSRS